MKTELTTEQSKHLINLGVNESPSEVEMKDGKLYSVFTLTDLLEILPKEIYPIWLLRMDINNDKSCVYYKDGVSPKCTKVFSAKELIDALYKLLCWVI